MMGITDDGRDGDPQKRSLPPPSQWIVDYVSAGGFAGRSWYAREEDARRKMDDLIAMQRPVRLYRMTPQLIASNGAYVP